MSGSAIIILIVVVIVVYVLARMGGKRASGRGYHDPNDHRYGKEGETEEPKDLGSGDSDSDDGGSDD